MGAFGSALARGVDEGEDQGQLEDADALEPADSGSAAGGLRLLEDTLGSLFVVERGGALASAAAGAACALLAVAAAAPMVFLELHWLSGALSLGACGFVLVSRRAVGACGTQCEFGVGCGELDDPVLQVEDTGGPEMQVPT